MVTIIEKLNADKEAHTFIAMTPGEQELYLNEILNYANTHKEEIIDYCHHIEPAQFCNLETIYEALAKEPETWGEFIYEEYKRIIEGAKKSASPFHYTSCLDIGVYVDRKKFPFADKIIRLLTPELESPVDALRHRAVWLLADWIEDDAKLKHASVIEKMKDRLKDTNWKIRYITNLALKDRYSLSSHEIRIGFWDTFKGKNSSYFSSPFEM